MRKIDYFCGLKQEIDRERGASAPVCPGENDKDMDLFERVSEDIKKAMLAREKVRLEALRGAKKEFWRPRPRKGPTAN